MTKVNVREVSFRRKFNLGNYETMDIELVASISEDQSPGEVLLLLDEKAKECAKAIRNREASR